MKTIGILNKTITLGLDYSSFTGGTAEVNRAMKQLDAEFNLAKEQAKEYGDETDITRLSMEKLSQQIVLQSKKVEESKKAYEKALESGKASQKQLDNLKLAYTKNETELQKLNNEMSDYEKNLEETEEQQKSFGDEIRGLASSLGLDVSPAIESLASKFDGLSKDVGNAIVGIAGIVTGFAKCTIEASEFADNLVTLSATTSISTDNLQKLQYASNYLDVSVESVNDALKETTNKMKEARNGSDEAQKAFKKLHVEYKDGRGNLMNAEQTFYKLIDALGKIKNETERDALAMTLFSESARNLNPLIEAGSGKLKELGKDAEKFGKVMSEDELDKLVRFNEVYKEWKNSMDALKNSLGLVLLPLLTRLFEVISSIPVPVLKVLVVLASVIASIALVYKAIKGVTDMADTISKFTDLTNTKSLKTVGIILGVVAALIALAAIIAVITGKSDDLSRTMDNIGNNVGKINGTVENTRNQYSGTQYRAFGDDYTQGGDYIVGENGPELVRIGRGHQIVSNQDLQSQGNVYIQNVVVQAKDMQEADQATRTLMSLRQERRRM